MKKVFSYRIIFICVILIFSTACNNSSSSKKQEANQNSTTPTDTVSMPSGDTPPPPPPPPADMPDNVKIQPATMCFENEGLKYTVRIRIDYVSDNEASVEVISTEIGSEKTNTSRFNCAVKNDELIVKSVGNLPSLGDASQWIPNKNWFIDANKPKQTLQVPVKAKNYETNKWEETKYIFDPCQ